MMTSPSMAAATLKQPTAKPVVVLTDNVNPQAEEFLTGGADVRTLPTAKSKDELIQQLQGVDGIIIRSATSLDASIFDACPTLKIVGRAGVGVDNVDLAAATRAGVVVVNSPEGNTIAAAEHTVSLMLSLLRNIPEGHRSLAAGEWKRKDLLGTEAYGKTLGIVGLGKIGSHVATIAHALGMKLLAYDPFLSDERAKQLHVTSVPLAELFAQADVVTLHTPKTKETEKLINADTLATFKPGSRLINCARGALIDETSVVAALESGQLTSVALDVFDPEPLSPDSALVKLAQNPDYAKRMVLTPHLGASTKEAQEQVALDVAQQIATYFKTGVAQSAVNMPALRRDIMEPVQAYLPLAEALGTIAGQWHSRWQPSTPTNTAANTQWRHIHITCGGELAKHNTQPITLAVLKGLLANHCEGVNYVNATLLAEEHGLQVQTVHVEKAKQYQNWIEVVVTPGSGEALSLMGTVFDKHTYRIMSVDGYVLSLAPSPYVVLIPHENKPGMVGIVASVLGNANINISSLAVAQGDFNTSMMAYNVDSEIPAECLAQLKALPGVGNARYFELG